ncbi:LysM peptidoglycan-binding domain-containing protein [Candidatus Ozemobacteraceae bacterium]|nr:LysM peptidoglycan-binding domain-containing protein [Candidatus Ozemobacteraceae bacterium]
MMNVKREFLTGALMLVLFASLAATSPALGDTTYTMKEGDTLWELSAKYYNDPTLYPVFLEVNNIDNPRMIPVGREIIIPSFDDMKKVAQEVDPAKRKSLINKLSSNAGSNSGSKSDSDSKKEPPKDEDGKDLKPVDPKSVSIIKILGGRKVDSKSIKDDKDASESNDR